MDKINGKGLSTNDYTTEEKNKLNGIEENANNYSLPIASSTILGGIKIGSGLSIDSNGVLSSNGGGSSDLSNYQTKTDNNLTTTNIADFLLILTGCPTLYFNIEDLLKTEGLFIYNKNFYFIQIKTCIKKQKMV